MTNRRRKPTKAVNNLASRSRAAVPEPDNLIPAKRIRELCGNVCEMTFWRWRHSAAMKCPPLKEINGRLYGSEQAWLAWRENQKTRQDAAA